MFRFTTTILFALFCTLNVYSQARWGSQYLRYAFDRPIDIASHQTEISLAGWRGETLYAQLVVLNSTQPEALYKVELSPVQGRGGRINAKDIEVGWVDEVIADRFSNCGKHDLEAYGRVPSADRIVPKPYFLLPKGEQRGVWLSIPIPSDAKPGLYQGSVMVYRENRQIERLRIKIDVKAHLLPEPSHWKFHLDFWQNPYAIARVHKVTPWSPEHFSAMRPYMERLARSGQKVITATLIDRPWDGQTYDAFGSMVEWKRTASGEWIYDFEIFDKWVEFMHSCGIDREISCFSMIPWKLSFRYWDEGFDSYQYWRSAPGQKLYNERWGDFLARFEQHLREKGWLDKTTISMDERSMEQMQEAIKLIRDRAPGLKISMAGNYHPEIEPYLFDYCVDEQSREQYTPEVINRRREEGKISTYYTCCSALFPNTFTFSPVAESSFIAWYALRRNLDGYLRWAYNSWTIDPDYDSRFTAWSSGDTYIVYPNNYASVRWMCLTEGIQQFEKYHILMDEAVKKGDTARIKQLEDILRIIDKEKLKDGTKEMVEKAQRALNSL
ncbi:MAG: DUF4091 domain-containing protein [Porphyromonas sp.]|nr:DUF4091 domain-containing protein [Porphyromonas sp.]